MSDRENKFATDQQRRDALAADRERIDRERAERIGREARNVFNRIIAEYWDVISARRRRRK
jgi:hypothetical protein